MINRQCILKLAAEKVPLLVIAAGSAIITMIAQQEAICGFNRILLPVRTVNAIVSYCVYIRQAVWPTKLAVFYPYAAHPHPVYVAACALSLIAVSVTVIWAGRQKKYLITGWLWYIVNLLPVIE